MYGRIADRAVSSMVTMSWKAVAAVQPVSLWWMSSGMIGGRAFISGWFRTRSSHRRIM
jgi:hypothetical protein